MAIEAVTDERPCSWSGTALAFVESYADGIVIGAAIALLLIPGRRLPPEPLFHSVLSVATPLLACLSAEPLHVSGVLAVVTCGLVTTRSALASSVPTPGSRPSPSGRWPVTCSTARCSSSPVSNCLPRSGH
ncbi:cation:proton antiporter domain-containing protein [Streptomyces mirabilis]|uniref:cation:proton antiporter domain-containing protein n=1 Tax=Streptomyces mirabilis TaxID=68239 RepID=UPI003253D162